MITRAEAVRRIRQYWPEADDIRHEGKCHVCKGDTLYSFADKFSKPRTDDEQSCGFFCASCKWSNAGSRPALED
jgi:hypothetical protein